MNDQLGAKEPRVDIADPIKYVGITLPFTIFRIWPFESERFSNYKADCSRCGWSEGGYWEDRATLEVVKRLMFHADHCR